MTSTDNAPAGDEPTRALPATLPRLVMAVAAVLLAAGALLYMGAAARLIWPEALSDAAYLSFGRLLPTSTGLLLGWLLVATVGAAWYVLPRVGGGSVDARLMAPAAALVAAGSFMSAFASASGYGTGGRWVEGPWYAEAVLAVGLLIAAAAVTRSARSSDDLPMAGRYLVAALWWAGAAAAVAAVPGLDGVPAALQARFAATALAGLAPVAAGLGAVYFLIGRLVPDAAFHKRLGPIGLWSLGFSWLWLSPATLQYGPTPDWLETVPVLFAMGLVVAMLAVLADLAHATRGRWDALRGSRALQLALIGAFPFAILVGQQLIQALRGPSGVVHFTDWESAFDVLTFLGAATLWLAALAAHAVQGERGWNRPLGASHTWFGVGGLAVALIGFWVSGLQQGYSWVAAVNDEIAAVGDAFRSSVVPLEAMRGTAVIGLAAIALAALAFLAAVLIGLSGRPQADEPVEHEGAGPGTATTWMWAVALFTVAGLSVFALPAIDIGGEPSDLARHTRENPDASPQAAGLELYLSEGCWQCHTQQVRSIVTDVGLGQVSVPGDYVYDDGDVLGARRIGPDLTHIASRDPDAGTLRNQLLAPPGWSVMPSYGHLSEADLDALVAYLASLE